MWKATPEMFPAEMGKMIARGVNAGLNGLELDSTGSGMIAGVSVDRVLADVDRIVTSGEARDCLHAGLCLLAGEWTKAHEICQGIPTAYGAAWHALAHRLEGDSWNSKYWWRKAAGVKWNLLTESLEALVTGAPADRASTLKGMEAAWNAARFVDLVERYKSDPNWQPLLISLQRWEWSSLFCETWAATAS